MLANTLIRLEDALGSKDAAADMNTQIAARAASGTPVVSEKLKANIIVAFADAKFGAEIAAAVVSGAALSNGAKRRCLIALGGEVAGNDLINSIQATASASIKL